MTIDAGDVSSLVNALEPVLPDYDSKAVEAVLSTLWTEQCECVRAAEGAGRLLFNLKKAGFQLGLISNTWMPFYSGFCGNCPELAGVFDYTVLSFRIGSKKPSTAIFNHALDLCGRKASECLFVGDSFELDIAPAMELGFQTAWVLSRPEREKLTIASMLRGLIDPPETVAGDLRELSLLFKERLGL